MAAATSPWSRTPSTRARSRRRSRSSSRSPITGEPAELNALLGNKLTIGYLPLANEPKATTDPNVVAGQDPRLSSNYFINQYYGWQFSYFPINFNSTGNNGTAGKIISQLYFRQALQTLVDQPAIIQKVFKGYGFPQYGPIPLQPPTYISAEAKRTRIPTTRPKPRAC